MMVGPAEAEEVVHDAFERAMREPNFFAEVREPVAWLRTVTAREALDRLRRRRRWSWLSWASADGGAEPWERADLAIALRRLPARARAALIMRYYEDATYEEIGIALQIAPTSVGPLLTRARAQVREALA